MAATTIIVGHFFPVGAIPTPINYIAISPTVVYSRSTDVDIVINLFVRNYCIRLSHYVNVPYIPL